MKKRNLLLMLFLCILSLCVLIGLLAYAFDMQRQKDLADRAAQKEVTDNSKDNLSGSTTDHTPQMTPGATPTVAPELELEEDNTEPTDSSNPLTPAPTPTITVSEQNDTPIVLAFAGDVNFSEGSKPMIKYDTARKGIQGGISKDLLEEMKSADLMMLNNEFPYSTRGTKTPDKSYTFRADPSRVGILGEMGVDIVSLANNHALDYGQDALWDTFDTLEKAGVDYVGAGANLDRAKAPIHKTVGNKKIAYVAASRVVFAMDWYATDSRPGMIGTYDPTLFLESIREAKANSDYVIAFVHWGVERNNYPEKYQRTFAKQYIDAGADAVIGCHPHVMQGFEYYKGKPIAYSLGNYWFNSSNKESGLFKLYLEPDGTIRSQILPVMGKDTFTYLLTKDTDRSSYFSFMEELSYNVDIDEEGFLEEVQ